MRSYIRCHNNRPVQLPFGYYPTYQQSPIEPFWASPRYFFFFGGGFLPVSPRKVSMTLPALPHHQMARMKDVVGPVTGVKLILAPRYDFIMLIETNTLFRPPGNKLSARKVRALLPESCD